MKQSSATNKRPTHGKKIRSPRATATRSVKAVRRKPAVASPPAPSTKPEARETRHRRTYLFAVGRRKSAIARVRFTPGERESVTVNHKPFEQYFTQPHLRQVALQPLEASSRITTGAFSVFANGGGQHGQAEAVRLGIARALVLANPDLRPAIKHARLLTRDPRVKERKKYGLKRARRAPQWQKR